MKEQQDFTQDIAEIRSMMERSSKFLSLSGWSGIMAGLYSLIGIYIAYAYFNFTPGEILHDGLIANHEYTNLTNVIMVALTVLTLTIGTAIFLSYKKSVKNSEKFWNAASRQLLTNLTIPLIAGGVFILIVLSKNIIAFIAPSTLLFYGLALFNAGKFTYDEVKYLGVIQMGLGLFGLYFIEYSIVVWAFGFGIVHIAYGVYLHFKYER